MTHYELFGVDPTAPPEEIRRAYLGLARRHHPDLHRADPTALARADKIMAAVNEAWHVLGDVERRGQYDRSLGGADPSATSARVAGGPTGPRSARKPTEAAGSQPQRDWRSYASPGAGHRSTVSQLLTLAPVILGALALASFSLATVMGQPRLLGLAFVFAFVGVIAMAAAPLLAMREARRWVRHGPRRDASAGHRRSDDPRR